MKKFVLKNRQLSHWKDIRNKKTISVYCIKKREKNFFNSLNTSFVNDNRLFSKRVKPFFSNKGSSGNKIKLVENDELLQDDKNSAEEMNNFFKNAVLTLDIKENSYITNHNIPYITDAIEKAIAKYKFHPSILLIKGKAKCEANSFDFVPVTVNDVEKEIKKLNPNKATTFNTIPLKTLIKTSNTSVQFVHKIFN